VQGRDEGAPRSAPVGRRTSSPDEPDSPSVWLIVGVNGAGKTTTVGKIARILVAEDKSVVLMAAGDTFRAAAVEQLATWAERVGVEVVRGEEGTPTPPASPSTRSKAVARDVDTVIVDTAGRLQTKANLMDELGKVQAGGIEKGRGTGHRGAARPRRDDRAERPDPGQASSPRPSRSRASC
jgi:signal recognition particle GTPase